MNTCEYICVEIRVYNNKKKIWSGFLVTGYYILPNLWEFRPRNSSQVWIEECFGTLSRAGSSNPTGGTLVSPRDRCDCQLNQAWLSSQHTSRERSDSLI